MTTLNCAAPIVDLIVPAGTEVNHYVFNLSDGQTSIAPAGTESISASFEVSAGTFTVTVVAVDANGSPIGAAQTSDSIAISNPTTITVKVPGKPEITQA